MQKLTSRGPCGCRSGGGLANPSCPGRKASRVGSMNLNQSFSAMMAMAMISVAIPAARGIPTVTAPTVRACERFPADRNDSIGKFDTKDVDGGIKPCHDGIGARSLGVGTTPLRPQLREPPDADERVPMSPGIHDVHWFDRPKPPAAAIAAGLLPVAAEHG
jgi:hypothetical protein